MKCRHCHSDLEQNFLDLGFAPPSNAYLGNKDLNAPELYYPLRLFVCNHCWLVQTEDYAQSDELFEDDYSYFSSVSTSWLAHAKSYCNLIIDQLDLTKNSLVVEVASNDGYLLKNFVKQGIPCLGIEPTIGTAQKAEELGIPVIREFFGSSLAQRLVQEGKQADLIIGNNVYAHVPDINDFTQGLTELLKPDGVITLEFPHLLNLLKYNQFDTVYHEHFSYLSLYTVSRIFEESGLKVFKVEELNTHGGSLRVYGCHIQNSRPVEKSVQHVLSDEEKMEMRKRSIYKAFQVKADYIKNDLLDFLIKQKKEEATVVGYGAAAKGNTLLNYAGIKPDLLPFVCDAAPSKQNKYIPGCHIPIVSPEVMRNVTIDWIIIFPWNIKEEIVRNLRSEYGVEARFVVFIPERSYLN